MSDRHPEGTIYLLHFDRPIGDLSNPRGQAAHYIGFAENLDARLKEHESGYGAKITAAALEAGVKWEVARRWSGTRALERRLKNYKKAAAFCPCCRGERAYNIPFFASGHNETHSENH